MCLFLSLLEIAHYLFLPPPLFLLENKTKELISREGDCLFTTRCLSEWKLQEGSQEEPDEHMQRKLNISGLSMQWRSDNYGRGVSSWRLYS